jgi:predicted lipid-binding transport protein (Tim44 family)
MNPRRFAPHFLILLLAVALSGLFAPDAEARRLGAGKSFGRQSSNVTQRQTLPPVAQPKPAQAAGNTGAGATAATPKPWGGLLGGLAAGLGLAWLANALGLGPAFANALLIALLVAAGMLAVGMLRRGRASAPGGLAYQGAGAANPITPRQYNPTNVGNDASARPWEDPAVAFNAGDSIIGSALRGPQGWGIPADFDIAGFTDAAKRNFITLQAAWDHSDIPALRAMMTDEMLAEIQAQLAEREQAAVPGSVNQTDVVMLEAQLLGIEELDGAYMASVEFSGLIREDPSAGPSPFREVWNMTKSKTGQSGWLVAGVQALQ